MISVVAKILVCSAQVASRETTKEKVVNIVKALVGFLCELSFMKTKVLDVLLFFFSFFFSVFTTF